MKRKQTVMRNPDNRFSKGIGGFFSSMLICTLMLYIVPCMMFGQSLPYPPSEVIDSLQWHWGSYVQAAPGSDLWPVTWAANDHLYASWGDGGGFGGTNQNGRVSLGFARIEGAPDNFTGFNVWGGYNPEYPATFEGKSSGMLSVNGTLYAWINMQNATIPDFQLIWSDDFAATWQRSTWTFQGDQVAGLDFLNFGKDYNGARDNYVYIYHIRKNNPVIFIWLIRVPKNEIRNRPLYEWCTGFDLQGDPQWSFNFDDREPVFVDSSGVGIPTVVYDAGIQRYLLFTAHGDWNQSLPHLSVFDAPEPWGPWTTAEYYDDWGGFTGPQNGYFVPTKTPDWMSADGTTIHLIFSGTQQLDSFNMVKATIHMADPAGLINNSHNQIIEGFKFPPVYPNPFNENTNINFYLPQPEHIKLSVLNILGQKVVTILDKRMSSGEYNVIWKANGLPSGIYFLKMRYGSIIRFQKTLLMK